MSYFTNVSLTDDYGNDIEWTMMNQLKIAESHRLCGWIFNVVANGDAPDANFWTTTNSAWGTATVTNRECKLVTTTTSWSSTEVGTKGMARYMAACQNYYRSIILISTWVTGNTRRRWAGNTVTNPTDWYFFQYVGTTFSLVARKWWVDTLINSWSFNWKGDISWGTYTPDTNYHTYEIYFTNKRVMFVIDGVPIHLLTATTAPLTNTLHFKDYLSNINTGSVATSTLSCLVMSINRFWTTTSQPKSFLQQGTTAWTVLKIWPWAVHSLNVSWANNNSVITLYDNTAASWTVLYTTGAMSSNLTPFTIQLDWDWWVQYEIWITLVISWAHSICLVKYE